LGAAGGCSNRPAIESRALSSSLTALLDALDDDALDALAERLAPHLAERLAAGGRLYFRRDDLDRWRREAAR